MLDFRYSMLFGVAPLALLFTVLSSTTATAQVQPSGGGLGICSALPDRLGKEDIFWMRSRLGEVFATKHANLLESIRIEEDQEDSILGPQIRGDNILRVPRAFVRRLCHQILLQTAFAGQFDSVSELDEADRQEIAKDSAALRTQIGTCQKSRMTQPQCLDQGIQRYLQSNNDANDLAFEDMETDVIALTYAAAEFLIAHEAAHRIMDATKSADQLARLTPQMEEAEADLYAQHHLFGQQNLPVGPMMAMATMSLIEPTVAVKNQSHPTAMCRLGQFRSVFRTSAPVYFKIIDFFAKSQQFDDELEIVEEVNALLDIPLLTREFGRNDCENESNAYVSASAGEINLFFDPLLAKLEKSDILNLEELGQSEEYLDKGERNEIQRLMSSKLSEFANKNWKSSSSKKISGKYIFLLASLTNLSSIASKMDEDYFSDDEDTQKAAKKFIKVAMPVLSESMRIYKKIGPDNFSKEDRIVFEYGNHALALLPKIISDKTKVPSVLRENKRIIDNIIRERNFDMLSYFYNKEYFSSISPGVAKIYFSNSDSFDQMLESYTQSEVFFGDCSNPKFRNGTMLSRIRRQFANAPEFSQDECEDKKAEIADSFNWKSS